LLFASLRPAFLSGDADHMTLSGKRCLIIELSNLAGNQTLNVVGIRTVVALSDRMFCAPVEHEGEEALQDIQHCE
jgi:hypothetical protein